MSKMHYFSNYFKPPSFDIGDLIEVARFGQFVVFRTDNGEIKLKKISYDVILVMSS